MIKDQASKLREIIAKEKKLIKNKIDNIKSNINNNTSNKLNRIISLTSGKGGVGKSTICANLGLYFASKGKDTTLLDADMGLANLDLMLGTKAKFNLYHVLKGTHLLEEIISDGPFGISLIAGGSGISELANIDKLERGRIIREILKLRELTDMLLIDTGAGISDNVLSFLKLSQIVGVIITEEPASIADGYGIIKSLANNKFKGAIYVIFNRVSSLNIAEKLYKRLYNTTQKFLNLELKLGGIIKDSAIIRESTNKMRPFFISHPLSNEAETIRRIGDTLLGESDFQVKNNPINFVERIFKLFNK